MSGNWQDALEAQLEIFKFWRSPLGQRYGEYFTHDKAYESPLRHGGLPDPQIAQQMVGSAPSLAAVEAGKMLYADPIYVAPELFQVAQAASELFQPEPLAATDLITPRGFVLLPEPFVLPDINGKRAAWRAFAWTPCASGPHQGIHLSTYSCFEDQALDDYELDPDPDLRWQPLHIQPWWFGAEVPTEPWGLGPDKLSAEQAAWSTSWWGACQALFRLMLQHISVREQRQPGRAGRRRWEREAEEPKPYVTVVQLRRPKAAPSGAERDVEWSHRWLVGGHWRRQWFPSLQAHRQIWISDYIKGPEDKPLLVRKARAFELVK